jgi:hypothetical protein
MAVKLWALRAGRALRPYPRIILVLIFVSGLDNSRAIVQLEWLCKLEKKFQFTHWDSRHELTACNMAPQPTAMSR